MLVRAPKGFIDESDLRVCKIGHPAPPWLVNYADLMTEMVCFFVILYALSAALNKNVQNAAQTVKAMIDSKQIAGTVKIDREGLHISLEETGKDIFFETGSADLSADLKILMHKLAPVLRPLAAKQDIIIEGHTDNVPIHNDLYLSNWELSSARATNVVQELIAAEGFPATHMGAAGYGEHRPVARNDTPEHRARNRRVVFFVKNSVSDPIGGEVKPGAPLPVSDAAVRRSRPVAQAASATKASAPALAAAEPAPREKVKSTKAPAPAKEEPPEEDSLLGEWNTFATVRSR